MTNYGPELNDGRNIFVFGSNLLGIHGKGAALEAAKHWGAVRGIGSGLVGESYGIPTRWVTMLGGRKPEFHSLDLDEIGGYVSQFLLFANRNPERRFLVTRIGCGNAGYTDRDIAPMFQARPSNVVLPDEWIKIYDGKK